MEGFFLDPEEEEEEEENSDPNRDLVLALLSGESNLAPSGVSRYRKTARPCRFAAAMSVASRRSALTAASSTAARVTLLRMPSPERVSSTCGSSKGGAGKLSSADAFSSAANSGTRGSYKTFGGARRPDAVATKGAFAMRAGISPSWCVSEPSVRSASSIAASSARGGSASSRASTRVSRNDAGETRLTPRHVSNTCASSGSATRRKPGPRSAGSGSRDPRGGRHGGTSPSREVKTNVARSPTLEPGSVAAPVVSDSSSRLGKDGSGYASYTRKPLMTASRLGAPASPSGPSRARAPNHRRCNRYARSAFAARSENSKATYCPPFDTVLAANAAASASATPAPDAACTSEWSRKNAAAASVAAHAATLATGSDVSPSSSSASSARETAASKPEGSIALTPASSSAATVRRDSDAAPSAAATTAAPSGASLRVPAPVFFPSSAAASITGIRGHPRNASRSAASAHVSRSLRHKNASVSTLGWPSS